MSGPAGAARRRRWQAPEVVQSSAMDCGPAALKSLLDGHGLPVHYGRLREACQTSLDGTSIDTLEQVTQALGLPAEQVMLPADHLMLDAARALPAIVVVRQADGATHFVLLWRRVGHWLQLMDPATGRRWVHERAFQAEALRHALSLPEADWRAWAGSPENTSALTERLLGLGADAAAAQAMVDRARLDPGWFPLAALDAALRLVQALVAGKGLRRGPAALQLVGSLVQMTLDEPEDIHRHLGPAYWSALPDPDSVALGAKHLLVRGAVLMRLGEAAPASDPALDLALAPAADADPGPPTAAPAPLSAELKAALTEHQPHPLRRVAALLRQDGLLGPLALCAAMGLAAAGLVAETLLFRGVFEIANQLALPSQRALALAALVAFAALLLALELPIVSESLRHGRHLEARLRMALLRKLPQLDDRYFQSRSISDMAERNHSIQLVRNMPMLGLNLVQTAAELGLTLLGVALIAPTALPWAAAVVGAAGLVPALLQPWLNERDLRLRNQGAALNGFYLDALMGAVPVRTHRAQRAVTRQHEGLLADWVRASRGSQAAGVWSGALQSGLCMAGVAALLVQHFRAAPHIGGGELLLVYWALKLPVLAGGLGGLARQYPAQRNVLARLFEPLSAPEALDTPPVAGPTAAVSTPSASTDPAAAAGAAGPGLAIDITDGRVLAGGHEILRELNLRIAPGEHVAVVGASGAGKSSLVGLLLGWHRLAEGRLRIDGQPLTSAGQTALRASTAWVDPGVQLWNRSLLDNLTCACRDASADGALARVGPVLEAAELRGLLQQLPGAEGGSAGGLQTPLGEGGSRLSGGQGQRVRLGRAMLQDGVRLALLDEPFRGLDREQRGTLLGRARRWWADSTLLCVTHDVGDTQDFPRVLVVDDGRIVEDGVPAELAGRDTHYARLLRDEQQLRRQAWTGSAEDTGTAAAPGRLPWRHLRLVDGLAVEHPSA